MSKEKVANKALVWWMLAKEDRLKLFINKELADLYFIPEDGTELMSWPEDKAEKILKAILKRAVYGSLKGLYSSGCPWCYFHEYECLLCSYGKRHGICSYRDSRPLTPAAPKGRRGPRGRLRASTGPV